MVCGAQTALEGIKMALWNPWHGCMKISEGCKNCYVYRMDKKYGKDSSVVTKNKDFLLPLKKNRSGDFLIPSGEIVYTCFSSDFFLDTADEWRKEMWQIIKYRRDLKFLIITKRVDRFFCSLPKDWGNGYENVAICSTVENQDRADYRIPIFKDLPIRHKFIVCEPLLGPINLRPYLGAWVEGVICGGESGEAARTCDYAWVQGLRQQCVDFDISFHFKQTGAYFKKDGRIFHIKRKFQHSQAKRANIDYVGKIPFSF